MRRVAGGAGESVIDMARMLAEAGVRNELGKIVAFRAHRIRAIRRRIQNRIGEQIRDGGSRARSGRDLAELVAPLQQMQKLRPMRPVGTGSAELAIVIAVVAVGTENAHAHGASLRAAIQIEHVAQETGLRKGAAAIVHHRVTRGGGLRQLRDDVQRICAGYGPDRQISKYRQ